MSNGDDRYYNFPGWCQTATYADKCTRADEWKAPSSIFPYPVMSGGAADGYSLLWSRDNKLRIRASVAAILAQYGHGDVRISERTIDSALTSCAAAPNPRVADPYSVYLQPGERNDVRNLSQQAVTLICNTFIDEAETQAQAARLSKWATLLDTGETNLRAHSQVKIKENDYEKGYFIENY